MASDEFRARTRATWAAGDWDEFASLIAPVGVGVLERIRPRPGIELLDVGTGNGENIAIPAALAGATVTGLDLTPELLVHARRHAADAGVEITWVEGDAGQLPFADASFDQVVSTFGAFIAPDHRQAAAELVRVRRPGGLIAMTTWASDGLIGEVFQLSNRFLPPPPDGAGAPQEWGVDAHVHETFEAAGATAAIARESVVFAFPSVVSTVQRFADELGIFVIAQRLLEPEGRWGDFLAAFEELVRRFNEAHDGSVRLRSEYLLIVSGD